MIDQLTLHAHAVILKPGEQPSHRFVVPQPLRPDSPLISCVMPTRGELGRARHAIECFRRQTYAKAELVIVSVTPRTAVEAYVAQLRDPRIRFIHVPEAPTLGELRNAATRAAKGDLICIWDDDDLSHPDRLRTQLAVMQGSGCGICFLSRLVMWWPDERRLVLSQGRTWEGSMLIEKKLLIDYPAEQKREDSMLIRQLKEGHPVVSFDQPSLYCYVMHGRNTWERDHFERMFSKATRVISGDDYTKALVAMAEDVPILEYLLDHSAMRATPANVTAEAAPESIAAQ